MAVPVIDVSSLFPPGAAGRAQAVTSIMRASEDIGFFQIVGHPVTADIVERLRDEASAFFAQPEAEKRRVAMDRGGAAWRGRYPPTPPGTWGVGEHTDYGLLTLLAQDDVGGLEVKGRSGWTVVPPLAGALVCNIGDMLEKLSGGRFVSNPHRVVNRSGRERLSFPFFYDPDFTARMTPAPAEAAVRASGPRWDGANVHAFDGVYGDYLLAKVGRVFPDLKAAAL